MTIATLIAMKNLISVSLILVDEISFPTISSTHIGRYVIVIVSTNYPN